MIKFIAVLEKFARQGEKTSWHYITIPAAIADKINPRVKKSYRVKGKIDHHVIEKTALMPMGKGNFIMAINAAMRKAIRKNIGAALQVQLQVDSSPILPPAELIDCLQDEPEALAYYYSLPQGNRNYFTKWIESAKTMPTQTKRIALVVKTMLQKGDFGSMLRAEKEERKKLMK